MSYSVKPESWPWTIWTGVDHWNYLNDLYSFNPQTLIWSKVTSMGDIPSGRSSMGFTSAPDGMLYLFGGWNQWLGITYDNLFRFNPTTATWSKIEDTGNAPSARSNFGFIATRDNTLLVFGGYGASSGTCYPRPVFGAYLRWVQTT